MGIAKEDRIITSEMELQNLTLLVNAIGKGEVSFIQGTKKVGVELRKPILAVTPNMTENSRRKGIAEHTHLIAILVIMNARTDINLVVEDHLIKTQAESILGTTNTEERIMYITHDHMTVRMRNDTGKSYWFCKPWKFVEHLGRYGKKCLQ
jgi:hypothetical protein